MMYSLRRKTQREWPASRRFQCISRKFQCIYSFLFFGAQVAQCHSIVLFRCAYRIVISKHVLSTSTRNDVVERF